MRYFCFTILSKWFLALPQKHIKKKVWKKSAAKARAYNSSARILSVKSNRNQIKLGILSVKSNQIGRKWQTGLFIVPWASPESYYNVINLNCSTAIAVGLNDLQIWNFKKNWSKNHIHISETLKTRITFPKKMTSYLENIGAGQKDVLKLETKFFH